MFSIRAGWKKKFHFHGRSFPGRKVRRSCAPFGKARGKFPLLRALHARRQFEIQIVLIMTEIICMDFFILNYFFNIIFGKI